MTRRLPSVVAVLALVAAACFSSSSETTGSVDDTPGRATTTTTPPTTEPGPPACEQPIASTPSTEGSEVPQDPTAATVALSFSTFRCSVNVVAVSTADLDRVALAARLAAGLDAPLLFGSSASSTALDDEVARLGPTRIVVIGDDVVVTPPEYTEIQRLPGSVEALAPRVNTLIGARASVELPAEEGVATVATVAEAIENGTGLAPPVPPVPAPTTTPGETTGTEGTATTTAASPTTAATTTAATTDAGEANTVPTVVFGPATRGEAWLVDAGSPHLALAAAAVADTSRGLMAIVDGEDLRRIPEVGRAMRLAPVDIQAVHTLGRMGPDAEWQVRMLRESNELPGGGYLLFEDTRMVALYGNPQTTDLGVLGEQGPLEAVERIEALAAPYGADGRTVIPAFEIIATVASGSAGADGNYSNEGDPDLFRPWIEEAQRQGLYVLLDLQPGRTDFLTQAKLYEEFLRMPHVGLALDPEWRLEPDQVHLRQFGNVDAAEVNTVVEWLSELVRREALPQKMLLLHQFRFDMLPDRQEIIVPSELAVTVQMDGQGFVADKYATWEALTTQPDSHRYWWGWKNFFDEDSPGPLEAGDILDLSPTVVYVSFQ